MQPKKPSGKPNNKVFKGFKPTLGYVFFCFPEGFKKTKKPLGKPKIQKKTNEHQTNLRENNKTHKVFKGFKPTLGYVFFCFFGFPEGF